MLVRYNTLWYTTVYDKSKMHDFTFLGQANILLIAAILQPVVQLQLPHTMFQVRPLMPQTGVLPQRELTMLPVTPKIPQVDAQLHTNFQMTAMKLHPVAPHQQLTKTPLMDQALDPTLPTRRIHGNPTKYSIKVLCIS